MDVNIQKLLVLIEERLGWGASNGWQGRDFEKLSELIFEHTKVKLSDSTLKRVWGKVSYQSLPSTTTLDALAQFAGFDHWRSFVSRQTSPPQTATPPIKEVVGKKPVKLQPAFIVGILVFAAIIIIFFAAKRGTQKVDESGYTFSIKTFSQTIPGSVIFHYDASAADDSVFIQYRWDERRKVAVDKTAHTFTAIQYEPGYYHPQLLVGKQVVKTLDLLTPTTGWMGWIVDGPVPVYLDSAAFIHKDQLELPVTTLTEKVPAVETRPPYVRYYNVGNFGRVPVINFSFSAQVKSEFRSGAAACGYVSVQLVTDEAPVIIPLSSRGCVSELNLVSFDQKLSGKRADLSGFGTDGTSWVTVSCVGTGKTIRYFVDGRLAFESPLPAVQTHIVGVGFSFLGTGAVRQVKLKAGDKIVFEDFDPSTPASP